MKSNDAVYFSYFTLLCKDLKIKLNKEIVYTEQDGRENLQATLLIRKWVLKYGIRRLYRV